MLLVDERTAANARFIGPFVGARLFISASVRAFFPESSVTSQVRAATAPIVSSISLRLGLFMAPAPSFAAKGS